jgi:hypothetical protein
MGKDGLLAVLQGVSIDVPGRTEGRKTEHTENWAICHLLSTLGHIDALDYPLSVQHKDKPDFILEMNKNQIGIEITESIPSDYAKCCAMAERENPKAVIDMSLFKWGSPQKTTEVLRAIIKSSKLTGDGWAGHCAEVEWAQHINDAVSTKLGKLNNSGYEEFPEYWLYIYDNLPLPNVHATRATEILLSEYSDTWKNGKEFSRIFIERGPIIIDISNSAATNHVLVDLWP